jgi:esterase/lipase
MSPETKTLETTNVQTINMETDAPVVEVKMESGPLATAATTPQGSSEWQEMLAQVKDYLSLDVINELFNEYRQPILVTGLVIGGLVTVKVALAILAAINEIPLLAPTFEMVGIGYSAWFLYRYVLKASTREELSKNLDAVKRDVLGRLED